MWLDILGRAWACLGVLGRAWACLGVLGFAYFFVVSHRVVGRTRACWGYWSVVGAGFSMYLSQN